MIINMLAIVVMVIIVGKSNNSRKEYLAVKSLQLL